MTASSTKTPAVTKMTSVMTGSTFFTGVTGGINGTNMTSGNNGTNETETDVYIEEPCIAMLSFGLWFDKICSELLPYICYEGRGVVLKKKKKMFLIYCDVPLKWTEMLMFGVHNLLIHILMCFL